MIPITTIISMRVKPEAEGWPPAQRGLRPGGRSERGRLRPWADECGGRNGECRARVGPAMVGCVTGMWGKVIRATHKIHVFHIKRKQKASSFQDFNNHCKEHTARVVSEKQGAGSMSLDLIFSLRETEPCGGLICQQSGSG